MYKTVVIEKIKDINQRAQAIESKANEMNKEGYILLSAVTSKKCQTILVFEKSISVGEKLGSSIAGSVKDFGKKVKETFNN